MSKYESLVDSGPTTASCGGITKTITASVRLVKVPWWRRLLGRLT